MRRKSNIEDTIGESPGYLSSQIITYLGNKRSILHYINDAVCKVKEKLGKEKLNMLDAFSGSGIVSRLFKSLEQMKSILGEVGHVETIEIPYTVYKASRSICDRPIRVSEYLFLVMKK